MCCDYVDLAPQWPPNVDYTVLEDNGGVSENEIDGAVNVTCFVKLTLGVDEKCVLVSFKSTSVENGKI